MLRAFSPAGEQHTTPPHQERAFIGGRPDDSTASIPARRVPEALGGLAVMRGSHRLGRSTCRRPLHPCAQGHPWACADYEPGDVLLVHCLTLHRAIPNRDPAGRLRLSADFRYRPTKARLSPHLGRLTALISGKRLALRQQA